MTLSPKTKLNPRSISVLPAAVLAALWLAGCNPPATTTGGPGSSSPPDTMPHDDHEGHDHAAGGEHAHPSEGPHHGDLVELGNEAFHAEVVHGAEGEVTIYILDSGATKAVPIDATELTINASHAGQAEQFKLAANPDTGDPAGKSSRFSAKDAELAKHLDEEGASAKLVLMIEGTQYTGAIEHDHDHAHPH